MTTAGSEFGSGSSDEHAINPGQAIESLKQELSRVSGQVQEYLKDQAQHVSDTVHEQTSQATETVQERIRENPYAALGIAAGVGFAVGMLMLSGRHSPASHNFGREFRDHMPRDISRQDLRRLTAAIREGLDQARSRAEETASLEKLSNLFSNILNSSTATSLASAGTRAAKQFVDRLGGR